MGPVKNDHLSESNHLTVKHDIGQNSTRHLQLKRGQIITRDLSNSIDGRRVSTKCSNDAMNAFHASPVAKVHEQVDDVGAEDVEDPAAVVVIADP